MKFQAQMLALLAVALALPACAGRGRVLIVRSDPADAEVCIKGKARSDYFLDTKSCVGTTPFEADRVNVVDASGRRHTVKFKDVEADKESFFVVVRRAGYQTQAVDVPGWQHMIVLRPDAPPPAPAADAAAGAAPDAAAAAPAPGAAPDAAAAAPAAADASLAGLAPPGSDAVVPAATAAPAQAAPSKPPGKGRMKITSEPMGALVYINEALRGNTPFQYESEPGPFKLRLELEGYRTIEKPLAVESNGDLSVNFKMLSIRDSNGEDARLKPLQTEPIRPRDDTTPEMRPALRKSSPDPGATRYNQD